MRNQMDHTKTEQNTSTCAQSYLSPEVAKDLRNSLARIEGHVGAIRRMVDERRCCDEILTQAAAVKAAMNRVTVKLVEKELLNCLTSCGQLEAEQRMSSAMQALSSMLKH